MASRFSVGGQRRWVGGVSAAIAALMITVPVQAETCPQQQPVAPSPETRTFRSDRLGVRFEIPANYRAMLRNNGDITFHDAATFTLIQCQSGSGQNQSADSPLSLTLAVSAPGPIPQSLTQHVRRDRPWLDFYNPEYVAIELAGQPALRYRYVQAIYGRPLLNVAWLAPDQQTLMTLTGGVDDPVLHQALSTLARLE